MKTWQLSPVVSAKLVAAMPDINPLLLQLLVNRGLNERAAINNFLSGSLPAELLWKLGVDDEPLFYSPFLFKNMTAAVELIIKHIKAGNKIVVYGDYDADGVTAAVILLETLQFLHATVEVYLPDRVSEGYGLNKGAIKAIAAQGVKLLITVDNGIRNRAEAAFARECGLDLIITDHHVLPEKEADLPDCLYINPADTKDNYPWKYLAGVGVAYKLVCALLAKSSLPDKQKKLISERCLDLVAVGTIADMVSLLGENRWLVKKGLPILNEHRRLGLEALIKTSKSSSRPLEAWNVSWQIAPRLNAASRLAHANSAFALLTTKDKAEAEELATELNNRNLSRQKITEEITAQVEAQIDSNNLPLVIIGVAGEDQIWNEGVIGLVAGRIAEKYYRPTMIITRLIEEAEFDAVKKKLVPKKIVFKGSGRSIEEFNMIAAVNEKAELVDKYGGHPMACGFSIKGEENLEKFKLEITELASKTLTTEKLFPKIKIDAVVKLKDINLELIANIEQLAPYGQNNPQPRFVSYNLRINDLVNMGFDSQHVKLRLVDNADDNSQASFWALAFGQAEEYKKHQIGDLIDLVYYLEVNDFNGRREPQLKIVDIKRSNLASLS